MPKDLNGIDEVEDLFGYSLQLLKNVTGTETIDSKWKDKTMLMDKLCVALCGDGNPTVIMNNLIKKDQGKYRNKIKAIFGGFHLVLEAHRKHGSFFAKAHLKDIFSS